MEYKNTPHDELNILEHKFDFLIDGLEDIVKNNLGTLDPKLTLNEIKKIREQLTILRIAMLPEGHGKDCICACTGCGENPHAEDCGSSGFCEYWTCC